MTQPLTRIVDQRALREHDVLAPRDTKLSRGREVRFHVTRGAAPHAIPHAMSLRQRLIVIVVLAAVVLGAAIAAIIHILATSDAARLESAQSQGDAAAQALADAYRGRDEPTTLSSPSDDLRLELLRTATSVLASLPRAEAGYCTPDGTIVVQARSGRGDMRRFSLAADHRAAVERACQQAFVAPDARMHLRNPSDTIVVSALPIDGGAVAWTAIVVRARAAGEVPWQIEVALLAVGTLILVGVTLDALFALRRGAAQLDASLARLQLDLRAEVQTPRAEEFAKIALGLKHMAAHLADARESEQALSRTLAHEQRLAGLGRVVAGVAHEIRNPLAGMKLRLDLLARGKELPGEAQEDVAACLGEIERLDRVVRSLLVVARRGPAQTQSIELGALVDERLALATELATTTGARLVRRGAATLSSDRDALARVIDNLLRNAIEASPRGGEVAIELACEEDGAAGSDARVELSVIDEGQGVPASRSAEMFEPFFTTKPEGTGLGLWLSRSLLEALGGTLDYFREEGRTRFRVTLPKALLPPSTQRRPTTSQPAPAPVAALAQPSAASGDERDEHEEEKVHA